MVRKKKRSQKKKQRTRINLKKGSAMADKKEEKKDASKVKTRKTNICVFEVNPDESLKVVKSDFLATTDAKKWLVENADEKKKYRYGSINKGKALQFEVVKVKKKIV